MKRIAKTLLIVLGVVVAAFVALVIALPLLIDPNDYKDEIVKVVKDKTGRDLVIDGEIGLSFFPWLGVEMNRVRLSNAPGFGTQPFAKINHAGVRVKLLPLLRKQVEVDRVILNELDVNLAVDAQGKSNWADLTAPKDAPAPTAEPTGGPPPIAALSVNGLTVNNGRLSYRNAQTGSESVFDNIEITTGALADGRETDVNIGFDLINKPATASTQGKQEQAAAKPLRARVDIDTQVQFDMAKETLKLRDFTLKLADLKLKAALVGEKLFSAPAFSGHIELAPFNVRDVLAKLGTQLQTQDPNALRKASLSADLKADGNSLAVNKLRAQVDESTLTGNFSLSDFTKPAYRFDLALDRIDIDRYLAPTPAADAKDKPAQTPAPKEAPAPAAGSPNPAAPAVALPLETLRALDADGRVRVGELKAFDIRSSAVVMQLKAKDGLLRLGPTQAKLYGGSYNGAIAYDARTNNPKLTMDENLKGVQVGGFLKDTYNFDKFVGVGNVTLKLTGRGLTAEDIKASLDGNGSFAIDNGVLKGIDIRKMGRQIEDAVKTRRVEALADLAPTPADETNFNALRATVKLQSGVAHNDDLLLEGAGLKVTGKGSASLPAATVDYVANVNGFPIKISGPFSNLKYRPDWSAILKAQTGARIEEEKQKLRERGAEAEQKARDKLDQKLKDFLQKRGQ